MPNFFDTITTPQGDEPDEEESSEVVVASETATQIRRRRGRPAKVKSAPVQEEPNAPKEEFQIHNYIPMQKQETTHLKVDSRDSDLEKPSEEREEDGELTVDIYDKGDAIMIQSTVAGVKPEDLDISITSDSVTIRGKRKQLEEVRDEDFYYKELFWGAFSRSIILPEEIDDAEAEANLKHGLLTIRLPKKKKNVVQKLKVKVT